MKKILLVLFVSFLFVLFFSAKTFLNIRNLQNFVATSPLPPFLTLAYNREVSSISLWNPLFIFAEESKKEPEISAKSAIMYELNAQKVLYEKNSELRLPMASLTKIMTAVIALEHKQINDMYVVSKDHLVGENSMGLEVGEVLTLKELLYGLILNSGNDAAEVIAGNFPGGRSQFLLAMNNKVKSLGLTNTNFTNPSGLQGDGDQYTTARDLLIVTQYALSHFPLFGEVVSTYEHIIPQTSRNKEYYLVNETNLISSYPGVKGVKDGYTPEAGLCLVTYLEYNGHKIVGVILGSENRRQEMKDLLDYSLLKLGTTPPPHD